MSYKSIVQHAKINKISTTLTAYGIIKDLAEGGMEVVGVSMLFERSTQPPVPVLYIRFQATAIAKLLMPFVKRKLIYGDEVSIDKL